MNTQDLEHRRDLFVQNLKLAIETKRTAKLLARSLGVTPQTIYNWGSADRSFKEVSPVNRKALEGLAEILFGQRDPELLFTHVAAHDQGSPATKSEELPGQTLHSGLTPMDDLVLDMGRQTAELTLRFIEASQGIDEAIETLKRIRNHGGREALTAATRRWQQLGKR